MDDFIQQARALDEIDPEYTAEKAFNRVLGFRIRCSRESLGWSQKRLAESLGVSPSSLSRIESGEIAVSAYQLNKLTELLPHFVQLTFSNKIYKVKV